MSQIQIQQSKYEEYAHVLETSAIEQWFGHFADFNETGQKKCAVGVLMMHRGWDGRLFGNMPQCIDKIRNDLGTNLIYTMQNKNDIEHKSFKEIAQWLREQE